MGSFPERMNAFVVFSLILRILSKTVFRECIGDHRALAIRARKSILVTCLWDTSILLEEFCGKNSRVEGKKYQLGMERKRCQVRMALSDASLAMRATWRGRPRSPQSLIAGRPSAS